MKLATLCYLFKDDFVLMLKRNARQSDIHFGKWNGLGGKIEEGESPHEAAIREIKEESGLQVMKEDLQLIGFLTFPRFKDSEAWHVFVFVGEAEAMGLRSEFICKEGELHWIKKEALNQLNLWEGDKSFLPFVLDKKMFCGKICYESGRLISAEVSKL